MCVCTKVKSEHTLLGQRKGYLVKIDTNSLVFTQQFAF